MRIRIKGLKGLLHWSRIRERDCFRRSSFRSLLLKFVLKMIVMAELNIRLIGFIKGILWRKCKIILGELRIICDLFVMMFYYYDFDTLVTMFFNKIICYNPYIFFHNGQQTKRSQHDQQHNSYRSKHFKPRCRLDANKIKTLAKRLVAHSV